MKSRSIKLMHEQLGLVDGSPIKVKWCDYDYFKYPYHFHSECEIIYILRSSGVFFAGNSIERFSDGDLILVGSHLPHMFKNDNEYYDCNPALRVHAIIVQFSCDFLSEAISHYPEFRRIRQMLAAAEQGIRFDKNHDEKIRKSLKRLLRLKGLARLLELVKILSLMSNSRHKRQLSEKSPEYGGHLSGDMRLNRVLGRLHQDYTGQLSLDEIARTAGMNSSAFCRYFREKTGKSMTRYINELRIGYACKLLLTDEMTVSQICYECGYGNLSNFNRHFKTITGFTPSGYVKEFRSDNRPTVHWDK